MLLDRVAHDRSAFDSGEPTLDEWLRERASNAARNDSARTYVICDATRVVAYHSMCTFSVEPADAPPGVRVGSHPILAILIARLAVDREYQRRGLGEHLLADALVRAVRVADDVAAKIVVVHALHEAAAGFYVRSGFQPFNEAHPRTLFLTIKDVRRTVAD
jgi:GNAT superfamily N-acetyltransferase